VLHMTDTHCNNTWTAENFRWKGKWIESDKKAAEIKQYRYRTQAITTDTQEIITNWCICLQNSFPWVQHMFYNLLQAANCTEGIKRDYI
jgi:hypothetical protein